MPDYAYDLLNITGGVEAVSDFVKRAKGERHRYREESDDIDDEVRRLEHLCFHALYPIPDEVLASAYDPVGNEWEMENWGTKWGAFDSRLEELNPKEVQYTFSTPYFFPVPFFDKVAADFPHLRFKRKSMNRHKWAEGSTWLLGTMTESWRREASEDEYGQLLMAWSGHLPLALVLRNLRKGKCCFAGGLYFLTLWSIAPFTVTDTMVEYVR